jgi:hypothetical protein
MAWGKNFGLELQAGHRIFPAPGPVTHAIVLSRRKGR